MRSLVPSTAFAVAAALAVAPAAASAAPIAVTAAGASGVTLTIAGEGPAARALRAAGVEVTAIAPAKRRGKRVTLPVAEIAVGSSAKARLRGGLRFEVGKRVVRLRSLRLALTRAAASLTGRAGGRRIGVLSATPASGEAKLDRAAGSARLVGARLALTRLGAKLLRTRLGLHGLRAGLLGRLGVDARGSYGGDGGPGDGRPGGPGGGPPQSGPISDEPPVMPRPASAVDVSGIAIAWYPRDSWVRYVSSGVGPQDGFFATGGATKGAPMDTASHPCSDVAYAGSGQFDYRYDYAPKSGWYDPVSGRAALYGQGTVRFRWESHTIDLSASDPEIEIAGADSRAIFRFDGEDGTAYDGQRAVLVKLDQTGQPTSSGGGTFTYATMLGALTKDGESVFGGFYPEGDGFGCVSASFTTN
jgi:Htaa